MNENKSEEVKEPEEIKEKQVEVVVKTQHWRFVSLLVVIILSWILVDFWYDALHSLMFNTFGLNKNKTLHVFIVAMLFTVVLFFYIIFLGKDGLHIENTMTGLSTFQVTHPATTL